MENTKFPIVIKKRNAMMLGAALSEFIVGIIMGSTSGGIKSPFLWIFVFVGIITLLSVWSEYSKDIFLKENKIEFYNRNDLIKEIKYNSIVSIKVGKGSEPKTKKKDFIVITFNEKKGNKTKNTKLAKYLINPMNYSAGDLTKIKNIIVEKNTAVKIDESIGKYIIDKQ